MIQQIWGQLAGRQAMTVAHGGFTFPGVVICAWHYSQPWLILPSVVWGAAGINDKMMVGCDAIKCAGGCVYTNRCPGMKNVWLTMTAPCSERMNHNVNP
jgi:hypothetical protein